MTKLYCFWERDIDPWVLSAEGVMLDDGSFRPDGYGGMTISRDCIIAIYPTELGRKIAKEIGSAWDVYRKKRKENENELRSKISSVLVEFDRN